jgi:hypothetical protein
MFKFYEDVSKAMGRNYWSNGELDITQDAENEFLLTDLDGQFIGVYETLEFAIDDATAMFYEES